jgi:hypothetical protein
VTILSDRINLYYETQIERRKSAASPTAIPSTSAIGDAIASKASLNTNCGEEKEEI